MRISESKKRRLEFYDRIKKKVRALIDKLIDILASPIEVFDNWMDRYERGYNDGVDAVCECAVWVALDVYKDKREVINERCNHILAVISEMELNYPELHTEVDNIEKSIREIKKQVK